MVQADLGGVKRNSAWYYSSGTEMAIEIVSNETKGIESGFEISNDAPSFSLNGSYIFFKQQPPPDSRKASDTAVRVDVWSYKDRVLQSTSTSYRAWRV